MKQFLEKLKKNDPDKELRDKGILPPLQKYASEMAMSDAPEDYLKRAVEQFIIDFPEFEDLQGQDLYDKMEEKGYFSDRYAMSDPHPMEGYDDILEKGALEIFGKPLRSLTNDQYEELEERIRDMLDADIPYAAKGGIIGLRFGGDPKLEQELEQIHNPAENGQQGIMQLASASSGNDKILSAMMWAATLPEFGSLEAVLDSLDAGETDINGLVNAYEDAIVDMN